MACPVPARGEGVIVPVLPLIDLLIILGWTSLMGAGLLKAIYVTTSYRPTLLGLGPLELVLLAGVCLLFGLSLAARTWVKYHEPELMARRRRQGLSVSYPAAERGDGRAQDRADLSPLREPEEAAKG